MTFFCFFYYWYHFFIISSYNFSLFLFLILLFLIYDIFLPLAIFHFFYIWLFPKWFILIFETFLIFYHGQYKINNYNNIITNLMIINWKVIKLWMKKFYHKKNNENKTKKYHKLIKIAMKSSVTFRDILIYF